MARGECLEALALIRTVATPVPARAHTTVATAANFAGSGTGRRAQARSRQAARLQFSRLSCATPGVRRSTSPLDAPSVSGWATRSEAWPAPTNCCVSPLAQKSSGSKASSSLPGRSMVAVVEPAPAAGVNGSMPSSETHAERGNLISFPCSSRRPALSSDPASWLFTSLPAILHLDWQFWRR